MDSAIAIEPHNVVTVEVGKYTSLQEDLISVTSGVL